MHIDNLFFILLIAGAAILRWLAKQSKSGNKNSDREEPPPVFPEEDVTEEERVRRFFDALGQPPSSKPPPRIVPRSDIPPRPVAPVQPPPIGRPIFPSHRSTPAAPREIKLPGQITAAPYEKRVFTPRVVPAPAFEIREPAAAPVELPPLIKTPAEAYAVATQAPEKVLEARNDYAALLRSTYNLRDIIVLREIFGPPRGLQDLATGRVRPDGGLVGSV